MRKNNCISLLLSLMFVFTISAKNASGNTHSDQKDNKSDHKYFIGSSLFMAYNLFPDDYPPRFYQINGGIQLTQKDVVFAEAITWNYYEPLGTYGNSDEMYPGKVRAIGIGAGYKRFHWKNLYSTLLAIPFHLEYYDDDGDNIQNGFQLYLQTRVGYRIEFLDNRWFIEPSVAFNFFPVTTNMPDFFNAVEGDAPNYFLFEPGLHFGFRF